MRFYAHFLARLNFKSVENIPIPFRHVTQTSNPGARWFFEEFLKICPKKFLTTIKAQFYRLFKCLVLTIEKVSFDVTGVCYVLQYNWPFLCSVITSKPFFRSLSIYFNICLTFFPGKGGSFGGEASPMVFAVLLGEKRHLPWSNQTEQQVRLVAKMEMREERVEPIL